MSNQKFDFNEANNLKTKLEREMSKVEADLNQMANMVDGVRSWWSGGSEVAFIENFKGTKTKIVKSLNDCIADYKKLVEQIAKAKQESDAAIAQQLRV